MMKKVQTLTDYQKAAMKTCMESSHNLPYMLLNLVGEVGEFSSKVAKTIRKDKATLNTNPTDSFVIKGDIEEITETVDVLKKEAGDILWQLSGICSVLGWSLEEIANINIDKLQSRKKRNVIDGDGDYR